MVTTPPRRRVLFLLDQLEPRSGGGERFAVGLAAHLPRDRYEVVVCATRQVLDPWRRVLADSGVPWFALGRRGTADVLPFRRLAGVLRRQRVDVLHAHMYGSNMWGSVIGRAARVPVVLAHEQGWSYVGQPLRKLVNGLVVGRLAHAFVAPSSVERDRMIAMEGVPPERVVVELNAYVPRTRSGATRGLRAELGLDAVTPLVVTACMLRRQKRVDVLLRAFTRIRAPNARLALIGDGAERATLEALAGDLGIGDRVHFLGLREDVEGLLGDATVAALSSDFEGTPLFAFECMAAGTPLVATAVGGVPEMFDGGLSAVLVPPRDPEALAAALDSLLADPLRRETLAAAARKRLSSFEIGAVATRFATLYERLLSTSRA